MATSTRRWLWLLYVALALGSLWPLAAQQPARFVYHTSISGTIDMGLAPYVQRALQQAEREGAAAVVLEINTLGGRVDAAVQIRDVLLASKVPTLAFINQRAISAGALIALSAQHIVMASGGTIGAATPVQVSGAGGAPMPTQEKTVSYVRKEFGATAERRGRPQALAEAMVDSDVVIPGVIEKGKLLTLTTDEALSHKLVDFRADTLELALVQAGFAGAEVRQLAPNWAENVVRFLTHPLVSSLLVSAAMLGILIELRTPGFGIPGAVGVGSLGLVLWGHWLVALAGWEELLLAVAGVLLLLVELLVIPGFGIVGALGIAALLAGLVLSVIGPGSTTQLVVSVVVRLGLAVVVAAGLSLLLLRFMTRLPVGRKFVLHTELSAPEGYASAPYTDAILLGQAGHARSTLRPAGIAEIGGKRVDVITDGEMVEAGEAIVVVRVDGNRVVVQRAIPAQEGNA